jgi:predicted signal transduction protein with EAL and GGDEF domain
MSVAGRGGGERFQGSAVVVAAGAGLAGREGANTAAFASVRAVADLAEDGGSRVGYALGFEQPPHNGADEEELEGGADSGAQHERVDAGAGEANTTSTSSGGRSRVLIQRRSSRQWRGGAALARKPAARRQVGRAAAVGAGRAGRGGAGGQL